MWCLCINGHRRSSRQNGAAEGRIVEFLRPPRFVLPMTMQHTASELEVAIAHKDPFDELPHLENGGVPLAALFVGVEALCFPSVPFPPTPRKVPLDAHVPAVRMTPVADRSIGIGIGVIGMGWMGQVPSRCHRAVSDRFRDDGIKARLVHCADGRQMDPGFAEMLAVARVSAAMTRSWENGAWEDVGEITG